jgi:hypothetical protein
MSLFHCFAGFAMSFLALGIIILATGLGGIASEVFGLHFDGVIGWDDVGLTAALAAIAWVVGEWVTGRLRMPLASLITSSTFALAFAATVMLALASAEILDPDAGRSQSIAIALVGLGGLLYYVRFRLPFTMLIMGGSVAFLVYRAIETQLGGNAEASFQLYAGIIGLGAFAVALFYELKDPKRATRLSENAFWLHLIAAPLLVFALTGGQEAMDIASAGDAVRVFLVVAVLGLIALMIDRRAFIVSALLYLAGAVAYAISQSGMPSNIQFASTALILGVFVVGLALGWQLLRGAFLRALPDRVAFRLPPHAQEWWGNPEHELRLIYDGESSGESRGFIAHSADGPFAYIQCWACEAQPDEAIVHEPWVRDQAPGTLGVDITIGRPDLLGKGPWVATLSGLLPDAVCARGAAPHHRPDASNLRAVRAYEKAGFARFDTVHQH